MPATGVVSVFWQFGVGVGTVVWWSRSQAIGLESESELGLTGVPIFGLKCQAVLPAEICFVHGIPRMSLKV